MFLVKSKFFYHWIVKKVNLASYDFVEMRQKVGRKVGHFVPYVGGYFLEPVIELIDIIDEFVFDSEFCYVEQLLRKILLPEKPDPMFDFLSWT